MSLSGAAAVAAWENHASRPKLELRVHSCDALEEGKEWLIKEDDGLRGG